jgi:ribosome-associated protein
MSVQNKKIPIKELPIRLGQFLKLANIVQDGFEAKMRIQNGEIMVNSTIEIRRGRQLRHLDKITVDGDTWIVDIME